MIHRVTSYSGLNYNEALDLSTDLFMLIVKEAVIEELSSTEQGRDYLKKCERLKTTDIDDISLKANIKER